MSDNKALELADYCEGLATEIDHSHFTHDLVDAAAELRRLAAVEAELERIRTLPVVRWEYRWTNPGDNPDATEDELAWQPVETWTRLQTLEQCIEEIRAHRYNGKPCYEVRALYALTKDPT